MNRIAVRLFAGVALMICSSLLACAGGDDDDSDDADGVDDTEGGVDDASDDAADDTAVEKAQIVLPPYPFWLNRGITVSEDYIADLATEYCAESESAATAASFFMGDLPMDSFDLIYMGDAAASPQRLTGNLYVSGYFGGLWLREVLGDFGGKAQRGGEFDELKPIFDLLAGTLEKLLALAVWSADGDALSSAKNQIPAMAMLYAYNLGYLQQIIQNPPTGLEPPEDELSCREDLALDCDSPVSSWSFLTRYQSSLDKLRDPPDAAWEEFATLCAQLETFVQMGAGVWQMIPLDNLSAEGYELLLDLSVNFLMASKAAVLGGMTAWADDKPQEGRYSLELAAGMISWGGSYFMGLDSPAPSTDFPTLVCP